MMGMPLICWTVRTPEDGHKARAWTDQITFEGFDPDAATPGRLERPGVEARIGPLPRPTSCTDLKRL